MKNNPSPARLPLITRLAFGAGDLGPAVVAAINGFFLNAFLIEVAGIRPEQAALIFLIVKIWDSLNDPFIGTLTDRTNSRWGRRRPWLLFGAGPFALAFFLQWVVPDLDPAGKFWYYLLVALLLDTGFTAVNVPYAAMTPELTDNYDERTTLNSYRFSFSILGGTIAAFVHTIIVGSFEGPAILRGYLISGAIWAIVIILSNLFTFAFTQEKAFGDKKEDNLPFGAGLKIAFRNRPFLFATALYLLSWLAIQFVQNNLVLYVKYWTRAEEQFQWLLLSLQLTAFLFLAIWAKVSERIGRQKVYYWGASVWIVVGVVLYFAPAGQVIWLYILAPLAAIGLSVCYLIPWSLLPDAVDVDELETGRRREGIFYGFFVFLQKLGISVGIAISNLILGAAGYIRPNYPGAPAATNQPEGVLNALRLFVSLTPSVILLLSFIIVYYYPITREKYATIRQELDKRK